MKIVEMASQIVYGDLLDSSLRAGGRAAVRDLVDATVPDPRQFVMDNFPETFLAMLARCSGKKRVMQPSTGSELAAVIPMLSFLERFRTRHHTGEGMGVHEKQREWNRSLWSEKGMLYTEVILLPIQELKETL